MDLRPRPLGNHRLAHRWLLAWLLVPFVLVPALFVPSEASSVRSLNLEEMTTRADRIFHGRCVQVRVGMDSRLGQKVTWVTFAPSRSVKGKIGGRITLKLLGDQRASAPPGEAMEGIPRFDEGEEVVLFLYADSRHGLTSPVGFGQGAFRVVRDKAGKATAVNQFGNQGLLDRLSTKAEARLGERAGRYRRTRIVPPGDLLEMAGSLVGPAVQP